MDVDAGSRRNTWVGSIPIRFKLSTTCLVCEEVGCNAVSDLTGWGPLLVLGAFLAQVAAMVLMRDVNGDLGSVMDSPRSSRNVQNLPSICLAICQLDCANCANSGVLTALSNIFLKKDLLR